VNAGRTLFSQVMDFIPWTSFERIVARYGPTNADRETFRSVMSAGSPEALLRSLGKDTSNAPRMAAAYMYFYDRVREFVSVAGDDNDGREQRLFGLLQALRTALQVVVIEPHESPHF
jgi:hypothetical protein